MLIAKTANQIMYIKKLMAMKKPIVVAAGPAGSGKTLFACQVAAQKLAMNQI